MTNSSSPQSRRDRIMSRLHEHLDYYCECYDNDWVGIFLIGSQNYELNHENSDVDSKLLVLPTFEDIALNKPPLSKDLTLPNGEHCVVRDVRLVFREFLKQSPNSLEILFTPFGIVNSDYYELFKHCLDHADEIARYNPNALVHAIRGIMHNTRSRIRHETESASADTVFLGKQLAVMYRMLAFLKSYTNDKSFTNALVPKCREELVAMKQNGVSPEEALCRAYLCDADMTAILNDVYHWRNNPPNEEIPILLDSILVDMMRRNLQGDYVFQMNEGVSYEGD